MGVKVSLYDLVSRTLRRFRRDSGSHTVGRRAAARGLRFESLESRQLLSITTISESWKTLTGTLTGTYSGTTDVSSLYHDSFPNCYFQETVTLVYQNNLSTSSGSSVSTGTANNHGSGQNSGTTGPAGAPVGAYTFTFSGGSTIVESSGQFQRSAGTNTVITRTPSNSIGGGTPYDIGITGPLVPSTTDATQMTVSGTWSDDWTVFSYPATTAGSYEGTLVQSGVFDTAVTAASWSPSGMLRFTLASTGPCVPVTAAGRSAHIASVSMYWADANGTRLGAATSSSSVGLYWNQAGGTYVDTDVSYTDAVQGATQLLIVVNEANNITGFSESDMDNNVCSLTVAAPAVGATTGGVFDPNLARFYLRYSNSAGPVDKSFLFGAPGWEPVAGDWNGDGRDTIGLFQREAAQFYLRNANATGNADISFGYGVPGSAQVLLMGDWNGDGVDTIGLYLPEVSYFELRNSNSMGMSDLDFGFGAPGANWTPVVGDWNGDGVDTVGLYDPTSGMFYLRNSHTTGMADVAFPFGVANNGWQPLIGDWNADGIETAGFYQSGEASHFYLRNSLDIGNSDVDYGLGYAGVKPIVGDWLGPTGTPLLAADGAATDTVGATAIVSSDVEALVGEALARWEAAGASATTLAAMASANVVVADLPGAYLGKVEGDTIYIDRDAAGYGWFVDLTAARDEEFTTAGSGSQWQAVDRQAVDRIDLLTVVEHELGHIAGLDDSVTPSGGLMDGRLGVGVRRAPGAREIDAVLSQTALGLELV